MVIKGANGGWWLLRKGQSFWWPHSHVHKGSINGLRESFIIATEKEGMMLGKRWRA